MIFPKTKYILALLALSAVPVVTLTKPSPSAESTNAPKEQNSKKGEALTLSQFVTKVSKKDPSFAHILVDAFKLKYQKDLQLPARDLVFSITGQYNVYMPTSDDKTEPSPQGSISLNKIFPSSGTSVSAGYNIKQNYNNFGIWKQSSLSVSLSQDIARNAFGRLTRAKERKIEIENELARHQIVEAYEDYLAQLMITYLEWYAAYRNHRTARAQLSYNKDLLSLIQKKKRFGVARIEDVHKMELEVVKAKEELSRTRDELDKKGRKITLLMDRSWARAPKEGIWPQDPNYRHEAKKLPASGQLPSWLKKRRTFAIMQKLEQKGIVAQEIADRNLLPSASLFAGYSSYGRDYNLQQAEHMAYFGLSADLSWGRQQERAQQQIRKLELRQQRLKKEKKLLNWRIDIYNLRQSLEHMQEIIKLARQRYQLAQQILREEKKKFSIGRSPLSELIQVKNQAESAHYHWISQKITYQIYLLEWRRLTDSLVQKNPLPQENP